MLCLVWYLQGGALPKACLPPLLAVQTSAWSTLCATRAIWDTLSPSSPMPAQHTRSNGTRWAACATANRADHAGAAAEHSATHALVFKPRYGRQSWPSEHFNLHSCIRRCNAPALEPAGQPGGGGRVLPTENNGTAGRGARSQGLRVGVSSVCCRRLANRIADSLLPPISHQMHSLYTAH